MQNKIYKNIKNITDIYKTENVIKISFEFIKTLIVSYSC